MGWRVPFLGSIILLLVSLYIRMQMHESPAFKKMKAEGTASKAPLREAFGTWKNGKFALIALFGLVAGQAVVWYSGQFYALFFIQNVVKVDSFTANVMVAWSLILGTGGFLFFGSLSDRIGRKPIILAGCLIAALTYHFVFPLLTKTANPRSTPPTRPRRRHRGTRRLLVPVQPDGHRQVHLVLRHRKVDARQDLGKL